VIVLITPLLVTAFIALLLANPVQNEVTTTRAGEPTLNACGDRRLPRAAPRTRPSHPRGVAMSGVAKRPGRPMGRLGRFEVGRFSRIGGFQVVGAAGPLPGIILKNEAANMSRTSLLSDQSR
jgi:hypothetical protein